MARAILLAAGGAWLLTGIAGLALATIGTDAVQAALPPLAIGREALSRSIAALAVGAVALGIAHVAIANGLGRRRPWAPSAGILLAGASVPAFLTLGAAALTAGAAGSLVAAAAVGGAVVSLVVAGAYGVVAVMLVRRQRSRRAS